MNDLTETARQKFQSSNGTTVQRGTLSREELKGIMVSFYWYCTDNNINPEENIEFFLEQ